MGFFCFLFFADGPNWKVVSVLHNLTGAIFVVKGSLALRTGTVDLSASCLASMEEQNCVVLVDFSSECMQESDVAVVGGLFSGIKTGI